MKILFINMTCTNGSTGKIVQEISTELNKRGHISYIAYSHGKIRNDYMYPVTTKIGYYISIIQTRLFGRHGLNNNLATKKLIKWIDEINPDVIHIHNIHGFYLNYETLFEYFIKTDKKILWTLHDCWAITGHCASFDYIRCEKWKIGCEQCPQLSYYPITFRDQSKYNYFKKKLIFQKFNYNNLSLTTPSIWLRSILDKSFLKNYDISVINNGIDTNVFNIKKSKIYREKYELEHKNIILSVMFGYNKRKGILDLNKLADVIDDSYKIILVGIENKDVSKINNKIIIINRTHNQEELANIYNEADVFVNFTLEEVFGMTNIEALACGTPVITYDSGGSKECIDENTGFIIKKHDIYGCYEKIKEIINNKNFYTETVCRDRVLKFYTDKKMIDSYMKKYEEVLK